MPPAYSAVLACPVRLHGPFSTVLGVCDCFTALRCVSVGDGALLADWADALGAQPGADALEVELVLAVQRHQPVA